MFSLNHLLQIQNLFKNSFKIGTQVFHYFSQLHVDSDLSHYQLHNKHTIKVLLYFIYYDLFSS